MTDTTNKKGFKIDGKIAAGTAGAVAGAALGAAAAYALTKKENREKVGKAVSQVKDQAMSAAEEVRRQMGKQNLSAVKGGRASQKKGTKSKEMAKTEKK